MTTIGVISDTHGLLRPEALEPLRGCDRILHAGDMGSPDIIPELEKIAPVNAVRGNVDTAPWAEAYPLQEAIEVDGQVIYMLHDLGSLALDPVAAGFKVIVFGHSHQPEIAERDGVLYLNPGSAGHRRFTLPVAVARLRIDGEKIDAEILELSV